MKRIYTILLLVLIFITSCVPKKQLDDVQSKYEAEKLKREALLDKFMNLEKQTDGLEAWKNGNKDKLALLAKDTAVLGKDLRACQSNHEQLNKTYGELLKLQDKIRKGSEAEAIEYARELASTSEILQEKEDKLAALQRALSEKENSLNTLSGELTARERKVAELQSIIDSQDSAVNALKNKISQALLGFENKGLTITHKNGKVYVSMENALLFTSGSYQIGGKGKKAIKQLAAVLNENEEINISVEGHTDVDKYGGKGALKDNWDLSVIRATQIVRALEGYGVNPSRLTASGRGEHQPLVTEDTKEAKSKNRRTEIILTPQLEELFDVLGK